MSMTEVLGPGAKCSTGQRRSKLQDKAKEKRESTTTKDTVPEKKRRETQEPEYQGKVRAPA
jgi:hypothetical protein